LSLAYQPVQNRVRTFRILRIVCPNELHLFLVWPHIHSLMVEEGFRPAFGGESFNCCLLLSFNLLLSRSFLLLLRCAKGLV
jgi:hypothetical protein